MTNTPLELECKPDFEQAMARIEAWYEQEVIDRPPVRFFAHNAQYGAAPPAPRAWGSLKERWFDAQYQVEQFEAGLAGAVFRGESFPVFWPNLGPEVYSAFYGARLEYGEVTAWSVPVIEEWERDFPRLRLDMACEYFKKLEAMTRLALERCAGRYMVGYTDLHPGVDAVCGWREPQQLCMDLITQPEWVHRAVDLALVDLEPIFNHFDAMLKAAGQLSVSWMNTPSRGKMHIPSCDFSTMISPQMYEEFCLPVLEREVRLADHNVYHLDGKGALKHLDRILEVPQINAIQWVQGPGEDSPIMQWMPVAQKILAAGKSVILDIRLHELEGVIEALDRRGVMLWIGDAAPDVQEDVLRRVARW